MTAVEYGISNEALQVTISELGGELMSVTRPDGTEYIWQGDPTFWKKRAPHLFPVVGRLTQGKCTLDGAECRMDTNGFFRWRPMKLEHQTTDSISLVMDWDSETLSQYPRRWRVRLGYALKGECLLISFQVENLDDLTMWFSYGGHPGFQLPLEPGLNFEDYRLHFEKNCAPVSVGMTDACFLGGEDRTLPLEDGDLPLHHSLFDRDALFLRNSGSAVTLYSPKGKRKVTVEYPQMPYLGLWHAPKTQAPYLCIEPWTALPARQDVVEELSQQADILRLEPGQRYENKWEIIFG